jgi:hypothetical protein
MFKRWMIDQEYQELCATKFASDIRVSEAAALLVLSQSGVIFNDNLINIMADRLGAVADEHGLCPEEIQSALLHIEPALRTSTLDF